MDFRKGINGLSVLVEEQLIHNPFSGQLFVFINRRRDKIKILYWERAGFCLWQKRLEQERFKWPEHLEGVLSQIFSQVAAKPITGRSYAASAANC